MENIIDSVLGAESIAPIITNGGGGRRPMIPDHNNLRLTSANDLDDLLSLTMTHPAAQAVKQSYFTITVTS